MSIFDKRLISQKQKELEEKRRKVCPLGYCKQKLVYQQWIESLVVTKDIILLILFAQRDELETEKVYEDFVKDFGYEEPRETVQTVKIDSSSRKKVQRQNVFGSDQDESDEDETNDKAREESLKGVSR